MVPRVDLLVLDFQNSFVYVILETVTCLELRRDCCLKIYCLKCSVQRNTVINSSYLSQTPTRDQPLVQQHRETFKPDADKGPTCSSTT